MRSNPNIIANAMLPPQVDLPDVNAMMQTRTAGMENIYKIEQARAEEARLEQERQAKTQEDAMIKALLPAYTYGIQTGDIEGAGGLVPPEMRDQVQPYIDALRDKPPEEVKSALIGSLSSLGQTGQEALAAIQRAETIGIQRGQLGVSRQRLAMDAAAANQPETMTPYQAAQIEIEKQKLAAGEAAAKQPKVAFRETDAEGNVRMYDAAGNEIGMLPKAGKPTAPAGGGPAATESERIAGYNAGRALKAAQRIQSAIKDDPAATAPGAGEAFVNLFVDPNLIRSEERQRVSAAQREMIDALLTLATGAAYNREQLEGQMESYIPRWTDEEGTREDKRAALLDLIENAKIKAGRSWTPDMDAAFQSLLIEPPSEPAPAAPAGVIDFNDLGD